MISSEEKQSELITKGKSDVETKLSKLDSAQRVLSDNHHHMHGNLQSEKYVYKGNLNNVKAIQNDVHIGPTKPQNPKINCPKATWS